MSKKNSNPHGSGYASSGPILPNSINNLSNLPRYDVRKSEDRSAWAEEYDRIEKELLQPALPNGMVLCVRHYAELVQKYPSTPNTERRQQGRTTSPSLKSSTRSKAQAKEQDGLHNHGLPSVETVTLSQSHFPNPRNILQPRPPSHSTHEAVAPRILPRLKVIPEANLGEDNVHSLKRAVAPHSHRIIPTHSSGTVEIKKNQIRTDVRSKSAGSYRLSIHRQLDNLEAGTIVNAESVAVLHTLLQPRPEFMGKFSLDLRYIDTTHILEQIKPQESVSRIAGRPCPHRTIDTFVNDASSVTSPPPQLPGVEGSDPVWINSPRSIYALLVEGLNIPSLLRTAEPLPSHQSGNSQNDTPTSGSKDGAAAHRLWQEMESERLNLLAHVQKTYHQICECVSREEVMQALRHRNDDVVLSSESSSVLRQQRQNQDNMLQAHRLRVERLEKADAEAKAALERAERRRAAMDRERHESLEDQRRRLQERLLEQQQKAEERRRMKEAAHEQHALELYERRRELDQRDRVVQETMQRAQQLRREKMCRARERKDARVQAARQRMVAHIGCIAQRLEEKTLQAHERKAALDARRHEAHERRIERQRIVETIRSTALQRAQFVQQQTRQRAEERQNHAALRLRTFSQEREHEREERRIQAQAIEATRKEAQTRAACALELRRTASTERLEQMRKRYEERVCDKEQHLQELAFQAQLSFELKNRRVQRRRRLEEFQKLRVADQLQTRTKKIEDTEQQMKKMHRQLLNMCSTSQS